MNAFFATLAGISLALWNFYLPLLRDIFRTGATALLPLAVEVVRTLNKTDLPSGAKRDQALLSLKREAAQQGISATESLLRWTIESAVQRVKLLK
jgi:hypothetical protein